MPTVAPNGVELYYEQHGDSGDGLVLVHGLTGDISDWRFQVAAFAPTYRVLVVDHRGHGRSAAPADDAAYSIASLAADITAMAAHAGFERFHLVGHSMGGAVAQEIALAAPAKLLSLTLEDTSYSFVKASFRAADRPSPLPLERQQEVLERFGRMSPDVLRACWRGLVSWQGSENHASAITVPTLIVCGEDDAPFIVDGSRRLAEVIPDARLHVIAGAAHCPQEEAPGIYNDLLRELLQRATGRLGARSAAS